MRRRRPGPLPLPAAGAPAAHLVQPDDALHRQLQQLEMHQIELELQSLALDELRAQNESIETGLRDYAELYDMAPVSYFSLARNGSIARANLAAGSLLKTARSRLIGKPFEQFVAPAEQGQFRQFLAAVFASASRQVLEVYLFDSAGGVGEIRIEANLDPDLDICRMVVANLADPSERASALRRAFVILDTISEGVMVLDPAQRIVQVNPAFSAITGYRAEEAIGRDPEFLADGERAPLLSAAVQHRLHQSGSWQGELRNRRKDGSAYFQWLSLTLVREVDGPVAYLLGVFFDITERKSADQALRSAHRALDRRVAERTADLLQANRALREENQERQRAEHALRRAEHFFHATLDALSDRVLVLDERGRIVHANTACRAAVGHTGEGDAYLTHCEQGEGWQDGGGAALAAGIGRVIAGALETFHLEYAFHDGALLFFLAKVTRFQSDGPLRVVVAHTDITERKTMEEALRDSHARLRQLAAHLETAKEDERKRIARDVHDELGQNLLALRIDISMLGARTGATHPRLHERVGAVLDNLDLTIRSVRGIINDLRPPVLDLGLQAALEWQLGDFRRRGGVACRLSVADEAIFQRIDGDTQVVLFRVLQEALTNIMQHAQARRAEIALAAVGAQLVLTVADDGVGIDPQQRNKNHCFGLIGIAERIAALDGCLEVDSVGGGCRLTVRVPLAA